MSPKTTEIGGGVCASLSVPIWRWVNSVALTKRRIAGIVAFRAGVQDGGSPGPRRAYSGRFQEFFSQKSMLMGIRVRLSNARRDHKSLI